MHSNTFKTVLLGSIAAAVATAIMTHPPMEERIASLLGVTVPSRAAE
jgi:Zn-dependent protease with chaperone function